MAGRGRDDRSIIVETKLHVPVQRRGLVRREALVGELVAGLRRKLTLISAAAGSGKTTLLAEWDAAEGSPPFAWLSLDPGDNDPVRFWSHVIEALRRVVPELGTQADAALRAPGTVPADDVLPLLVNELAASEQEVVLVLDDYHVIRAAEVHDSVLFLVEHMPAGLHLAVATRADPPLPLARLRVRDELTELRGADLRFTEDQAARFLNAGLGLSLGPGDVSQLQQRTEGWAAGLQLAGLSLRDHPDPGRFITAFAGDDRHIVDYLGAEVIDGLPEHLRLFLLRTSILARLSAPLCAAVSDDADAGARLEELERANLFLVPLDTNRRWYRYHHLFGELLRRRLEEETPDMVELLNLRASAWHRNQGLAEEAIGYAIAAGDAVGAAELVAEHWDGFFNSGRLTTVAGWLDALPRETLEADTRLWLARVWTSLDRGRLAEVEPWLTTAHGEWPELLSALHRFKSGELPSREEGLRWAREAAAETDRSAFWRTVASCVAGVTLFWKRALDEAPAVVQRGLDLAQEDENLVATSYLLGYQALLKLEFGAREEAAAVLARAEELRAERPELEEHFTACVAHLARGKLLASEGSRAAAEAELARGVALARRGAGAVEVEATLTALAALDGRPARRLPSTPGEELSDRELEVLRLLSTSMSQREIGDALYVSVNTVKSHVRSIFRKLDAAGRREAVARARERGLV